MSLKDKLQKLKNAWLLNRDYEFDAELENHPLGNQNIYRLYFIDYHRIGEGWGMECPPSIGVDNIGVFNWPFKPFMLPEGMSREDAFKVLSYLTDFIEKEESLETCSFRSVKALDKVIDLERLGFKRIDINLNDDSHEVIDLFTIKGRVLLFKQSKQYQKYFEWYTNGITLNQVKKIYNKCGIEFYDLVPTVKEEEKNNSNGLKLIKTNKK